MPKNHADISKQTLSCFPSLQPEISTCTPEFARERDHTMCLRDDERVLNTGVTERQKKVIIDYHNKVRRNVQPPATDLTPLVSCRLMRNTTEGKVIIDTVSYLLDNNCSSIASSTTSDFICTYCFSSI